MRRTVIAAAAIALMLVLVSGCGGETTEETSTQKSEYQPEIDPADFVEGIDNQYLPLDSGTTFVYEGNTGEGLEHIEVEVTDEKKVVMGVQCTVVLDTVTIDGEVVEVTYDWYAQDKEGNVWYFGEDSKEYENGKPVNSAGSWEAGVDGALPGIVMRAQPEAGHEYRQEYYEGEAEDMAEVASLDETISLATGASFSGCLKIKEWTPLEPGVVEFKYYAPDVGLILETAGESETQRIELVEIREA
ncbi:MAG: hypothetical protein AB1384_13885 [Actinomycetota bacterium]